MNDVIAKMNYNLQLRRSNAKMPSLFASIQHDIISVATKLPIDTSLLGLLEANIVTNPNVFDNPNRFDNLKKYDTYGLIASKKASLIQPISTDNLPVYEEIYDEVLDEDEIIIPVKTK